MNLVVPHIKQTNETSCGAAALGMIYSYYGIINQHEMTIWNRLKEPRPLAPGEEFIKTSRLAEDVVNFNLNYIRGQAVWTSKSKSIKLLKTFNSIAVPVIVCQKFRKNKKFGHFRIVIGIKNDKVILNDPEINKNKRSIKVDDFMDLWEKNSDEVIGGEFVAILDNERSKKMGEIEVVNFWANIDYFKIKSLHFKKT